MRMLLQQAETGLYFKHRNAWTDNVTEALVLNSWLSAYDYVVFNRLRDTFIVPLLADEDRGRISEDHQVVAVTELDLK